MGILTCILDQGLQGQRLGVRPRLHGLGRSRRWRKQRRAAGTPRGKAASLVTKRHFRFIAEKGRRLARSLSQATKSLAFPTGRTMGTHPAMVQKIV
jgi:hypothetical protein